MYSNYDHNQYDYSYDARQVGLSWSEYLTGTFRWMTIGLAVTFVTAYLTATTPMLFNVASALFLPLTIVELVLVMWLSVRVQNMQVSTARGVFLGYSFVNGLVFSMYFLLFDLGSLMMAFLAAAVFFGLSALHGARTQNDLSAWGPRLLNGLLAMIIASVVGMLFGFGFVGSLLYCGLGVLLFLGLTAYDVQKLQHYYYAFAYDEEMAEKSAIFGALGLYLDFINIFLYLVRIFGRSRRD
ncbi:MAG: Bax inhibitor-1/YccA family protein [Faecalibacterium sp.]|nr:Bax inhibitor-1/YccA family protein [Faecalibacterium sp.]